MDCFVAFAPLRKRFAFVAGNDDREATGATNWHDGQNFSLPETQITGTS
jgi:hypothetical protein